MSKSERMVLAVVAAALGVGGLAGAAGASVHFVSQSNVWAISYSRADFSDAVIEGANTVGSTADAAGDSTVMGWGRYQNPLQNEHVTTTGGVVVDGIMPGLPFTYTVHHPTGAPGTNTYHFTRPQPDGPGFVAGPVGGLWALHLSAGSSPVVEAGDPFTWTLTIPGDWSSQGMGPGQSQLVSFDPAWTVTRNFVFDGMLTTLELSRMAGGTSGPAVTVNFYEVPAPGAGVVGMMGALAMGRRRRRVASRRRG